MAFSLGMLSYKKKVYIILYISFLYKKLKLNFVRSVYILAILYLIYLFQNFALLHIVSLESKVANHTFHRDVQILHLLEGGILSKLETCHDLDHRLRDDPPKSTLMAKYLLLQQHISQPLQNIFKYFQLPLIGIT